MSQEAWNNFSESYNLLSDKMQQSGINISLLEDVITAYEKVIKSEVPTVLSTHLSNINRSYNLDGKLKVVNVDTKRRKVKECISGFK